MPDRPSPGEKRSANSCTPAACRPAGQTYNDSKLNDNNNGNTKPGEAQSREIKGQTDSNTSTAGRAGKSLQRGWASFEGFRTIFRKVSGMC